MADHKAIATGAAHSDEESVQSAMQLVSEINEEVNRQLEERIRIYEQKILPALRQQHIIFYQSRNVEPFHKEFLRSFFREEIFPYLSPVPVSKDKVISFLRDNRLYLAIRLYPKGDKGTEGQANKGRTPQYFVMKLPYSKVPRFIELPKHGKNYYLMFIEDIIKANIDTIFPRLRCGQQLLHQDFAGCGHTDRRVRQHIRNYRAGEKQSEKTQDRSRLPFCVRPRHARRFSGLPCRCLPHQPPGTGSGRQTPQYGRPAASAQSEQCRAPHPQASAHEADLPGRAGVHLPVCGEKKDLLLHYPYHSFEHFIHFLYEAVHEPTVREIMVTQYRVAENSAVINTLIAAAQNGKKVTVFVELKARFDEENNLATAEMMKAAGINILFSLPGLKVHAKVALVLRRDRQGHKLPSYAYISTGNFNEKTATLYADSGLFTCNPILVNDLHNLFRTFQGKENPVFHRLLVARFNLIPELNRLIDHEIELAKSGKQGRIILKMNALQDPAMIDRLYEASQAGVRIDLIVRGICCLIPGRKYSRNIRVTRIVDTFLEHARVWYFGNGGKPKLFLGSPDWMRRNLYRRIEAVTPILDPDLKRELSDMLSIQLSDKRKACFVDDHLRNRWKSARPQKGESTGAIYFL